MNNNPNNIRFSIMMANHNRERYIEEAIKSVLHQTYPFWELIIVDDASTDKSIEIINKFKANKKIKLIQLTKNVGPSGAQRIAIENSNYEIIVTLDSDDLLSKDALKELADAYEKYPNCGFIYSTMWRFDSESKKYKIDKTIKNVDVDSDDWLINPPISHLRSFRKNSYLKTEGFEIGDYKAGDKEIIYKLSEVTKFKFINKPLYYYREHTGGMSQGSRGLDVRVYDYLVKYKTYKRRLGTNLPNFNFNKLKSVYFYNLMLYNSVNSIFKVFTKLKFDFFLNNIIRIIPLKSVRKKLGNIKNRYIDIFG